MAIILQMSDYRKPAKTTIPQRRPQAQIQARPELTRDQFGALFLISGLLYGIFLMR